MGVKAVVVEQSALNHLHECLQGGPWQAGLLVGKRDKQKWHVCAFLPRPKKGGPLSIAQAKPNWMAQYAVQVRQLLCGGVHIVGIYVADIKANTQSNAGSVLGMAWAVACHCPADCVLVAEIAQDTSRYTWKSLSCSDKLTFPAKVEACSARFISTWHSVKCRVSVSLSLSLQAATSGSLVKAVDDSLPFACKQAAHDWLIEIDGTFPSNNTKLSKLQKRHHTAVLYKPWGSCHDTANKADDVDERDHCCGCDEGGAVSATGEVCCMVYAQPDTTVQEVFELIGQDLNHTLNVRLKLMVGSWEGRLLPPANDKLQWSLPRRVSCVRNGVGFCDYVFEEESLEDCAKRLSDLIGQSYSAQKLSLVEGPQVLLNYQSSGQETGGCKGSQSATAAFQVTSGRSQLAVVLGIAALLMALVWTRLSY